MDILAGLLALLLPSTFSAKQITVYFLFELNLNNRFIIRNMSSLKLRLLIALFTFAFGMLLVWAYFSQKQPVPAQEEPNLTTAAPVEVPKPALIVEQDNNLQAQTDELLPLFDNMEQVPISVKDEPVIKSGTANERRAAYTTCLPGGIPTIYLKKNFYEKASQIQLTNILKHELTHAWLCRQNLMSNGHGSLFRQKFTQIGGFGN